MKILLNKQKDELLKHVAACQIIANNYINDINAYTKMTENLADMAIKIGGCEGATKVQKTASLYYKKGERSVMTYAEMVYDIMKSKSEGMDAIYEDYILHLVGFMGLNALKEHRLVETCGVVNGRQLYALCEKK